jgi:hypothetical protein
MLDGDLFCRSVIYPKGWDNDVFSFEGLVDLRDWSEEKDRKRYIVSVASSFLLRSEDRAHKYGCSVAASMKARALAGVKDDNRDVIIPHYLGYYEAYCGSIKSFALDYYRMELKWSPENGNDEHFDLAMVLTRSLPTSKAHRDDLKEAKKRIAAALMGPKRRICECDAEIADSLTAIELPERAYIPYTSNP